MKTLAAFMNREGINQTELAEMIGSDRHQVSRWMQRRKAPTLETIVRIHQATRIPIDRLVMDAIDK